MKTVFVGLSGGVDSAVSAALLKSEGYRVVGAFIKIWQPEFTECTWQEDRLDAMRVAAALGIPFKEIDLSEEYKNEVVTKMVEGYARGITPNPDVLCNSKIKFGPFAQWAFSEGADVIATGHYARTERVGNHTHLLRGGDENKDQSYFLWQLSEKDLSRVLFPVGTLTKTQVRAHAERLRLPVAAKSDSQGLCFVGAVTIPQFLKQYISVDPGEVLDEHGTSIGVHEGAALYTLGQRHGFNVDSTQTASTPYFVIATDIKKNTITVSSDRTKAARNIFSITDTRWVDETPTFPLRAEGQVRYRSAAVPLTISKNTKLEVKTEKEVIAASGQSLVVYENDRVLGGGIIS